MTTVVLPAETVGLGIILDHVSGQGVESVQASLLTVDSLDAVELAHQTIVQADVQSALGNVDGPVGAGVALDAQRHSPERPAASS